MIVQQWPWWFRNLYGGSWPAAYIAWDLETTGFDRDHDVIVEIGHCLVEGCKVVDRLAVVLDWTEHPVVPDAWLRRRLEDTRRAIAASGKTYTMTYERMRREGIKPEKALKFYFDLFKQLIDNRFYFVAHNGAFDEAMLLHNLVGFRVIPTAADFVIPDNQVFDTMSIEKANQMVGDKNALPRKGETLRSYFHRIHYIRNRIKSSLDGHAVPRYDLVKKHNLDMTQAHTAGFDAYLVYLLMEEFRAAADAAPAAVTTTLAPCPAPVRELPEGVTTAGGGRPLLRRRGQRNR